VHENPWAAAAPTHAAGTSTQAAVNGFSVENAGRGIDKS